MPMPRWMATVNKYVFNRFELRRGNYSVLIHRGRNSGREYRTPLEINRADDAFLVAIIYTAASDWVRNVLAAGSARVATGGEEFDVTNPRIIAAAEAVELLPDTFKPPPDFLRVDRYLRLEIAP